VVSHMCTERGSIAIEVSKQADLCPMVHLFSHQRLKESVRGPLLAPIGSPEVVQFQVSERFEGREQGLLTRG
jgi:hypothetical protein